jgi:hypothetical protein
MNTITPDSSEGVLAQKVTLNVLTAEWRGMGAFK